MWVAKDHQVGCHSRSDGLPWAVFWVVTDSPVDCLHASEESDCAVRQSGPPETYPRVFKLGAVGSRVTSRSVT